MIISDTQKFIFLHIPKCGGTTIRKSLINFDTRNNYFWMFDYLPGAEAESPKLQVDKAHMTLAIFKQLYPRDFELLNDYTVFAFSRNPIKRLISSFWEPRKRILKTFDENQLDINLKNKIQELFNLYLEKLVLNYSFLDPSYLHSTPQNMYVTFGKKVVTDVIIKLDAEGIFEAMKSDKKNTQTINLILLKEIGQPFLFEETSSHNLQNFITKFINDFKK